MSMNLIEDYLERIAKALEALVEQGKGGEWVKGTKEDIEPIKVAVSTKSRMLNIESEAERTSSATHKKAVITTMKRLKKKGCTYKEIADKLNEEDVKTFGGNGKWWAQTVHRLCK